VVQLRIMRIVAGSARGRKLILPTNSGIRPTKDRVREAIFNSLHSYGLVEDRQFLDLFAGTGSLGLEALSRGASSVVFVDNNDLAIDAIKQNSKILNFIQDVEIRRQDAMAYLSETRHFDVALLDPPYNFEMWDELTSQINSSAVVVESSQKVSLGRSWAIIKEQSYGQTNVVIAVNEGVKTL
tara:strand:- start:4795 stop:5343 length:549 start_codon:yes stop_codon:yes gene_type:complete